MFDSQRGSPRNFYHSLPFQKPLADKRMVEANPHELCFPQGSRQPSQQRSAEIISDLDARIDREMGEHSEEYVPQRQHSMIELYLATTLVVRRSGAGFYQGYDRWRWQHLSSD